MPFSLARVHVVRARIITTSAQTRLDGISGKSSLVHPADLCRGGVRVRVSRVRIRVRVRVRAVTDRYAM